MTHFSVVTPSFRQLDWLRLCINSVADQGGVAVEHIIQDAGTESISERTLRPASASSGYTLRLQSEIDDGMYDAINRGLRRATGEFCAYLNCDEQYLPATLSKVAEFFQSNPQIDVLFGDVILTNKSGNPISYRRAVLPTSKHVRLVHLNTSSCATFFRRHLIERGFFFQPKWKAIGDSVWVYSLLRAATKMAVLPEPLAIFTFTGQNLGATAISKKESREFRGGSPSNIYSRPLAIITHRIRKMLAGAYMRRDLEIEIYTRDSPQERQRHATRRIGFGWPTN